MILVDDNDFQHLIDQALTSLKSVHANNIANIAILYEDEPTPKQREELKLRDDQSLFGLYEGVPLPKRLGQTRLLPDKITLFKIPLVSASNSIDDLRENIRHTLWHEIAHYYGLDHDMIRSLEK